jgi:uncharacterized membrane protein
MPKHSFKTENTLDKSFDLVLLLKALFASFEILAGIAMIFITPDIVHGLMHWASQVRFIATHDLLTDLIQRFDNSFNVSKQWLTVIYLLSHGLIKLVVIICLFRRILKAYPISMVILILFIIFQTYEIVTAHSIMMILATLIDLAVLYLTWREYKELKEKSHSE